MVRYRIVLDRSSRDGDAMIAPYIVPGPVWACGVCGEDSNEDDRACWFCHTDRGDWICDRDGHKNPAGADECEECGSPKPDDA